MHDEKEGSENRGDSLYPDNPLYRKMLRKIVDAVETVLKLFPTASDKQSPIAMADDNKIIIEQIEKQIGKKLECLQFKNIMNLDNGFFLNHAGQIQGLNLNGTKFKDISVLSNLKELTHLSLANNKITDITPLGALTKLTELDLRKNQITNITPLISLKMLRTLILKRNQITNFMPLQELKNLTVLDLHENKLTDTTLLQDMAKPTELYLNKNELNKDFLEFATQDMLNDLTVIKGHTFNIKTNGKIDVALQKKIENIYESAEQASKKLNEIIDKAVKESGNRLLYKTEVDIGKLAQKVVNQHKEYASWKKIHIEDSIENDCIVYGDEMVLEEIIDNLVSNAIKFSPAGKKVQVSISKAGDQVKIIVKDEGPGFTDEDKLNLYKKYKPLSARPTGGEPSIGMGLYITKDYVDLHHGTIYLESDYGNGALFTVEIPINKTN